MDDAAQTRTEGYPYTDLGPYLHELPIALRLEREKLYRENLLRFEDKMLEVIEKTAKYLLAMNGGGLTLIAALAGAFFKDSNEAMRLLPAGTLFVIGLALCGFPLMHTSRHLIQEYVETWSDTVAMFTSKLRIEHAGYKLVARRSNKDERHFPFLPASFYSFICGAIATVIGVAWPQIFDFSCSLFSALWRWMTAFF